MSGPAAVRLAICAFAATVLLMLQFSALLREEIDLDSLSGDLLDVVSKTVQPRDAGIWLRPVTLAERGTDTP